MPAALPPAVIALARDLVRQLLATPMTQVQVGKIAGIDQGRVSELINKEGGVGIDAIARLAVYLNREQDLVDAIFGRNDPVPYEDDLRLPESLRQAIRSGVPRPIGAAAAKSLALQGTNFDSEAWNAYVDTVEQLAVLHARLHHRPDPPPSNPPPQLPPADPATETVRHEGEAIEKRTSPRRTSHKSSLRRRKSRPGGEGDR